MYALRIGFMKPNLTPIVLLLMLVILVLQGCADVKPIKNQRIYGDINTRVQPVVGPPELEPLFAASIDCSAAASNLAPANFRVDKPVPSSASAEQPPAPALQQLFSREITLSPGDLLEIAIENGEGFSGRYEINTNGYLKMPQLDPLPAIGLNTVTLAEKIELALVKADMFRAHTLSVSVQLLRLAEIEVTVSGAVFEPGRVLINEKIPAQVMDEKTAAAGDYTPTRMLSEALRGASGVRPDAKLDQILLIRNGWQVGVDMSGVLTGQSVQDLALVAGDRIIVPTLGCFQPHLVRPSQITPKGFRVFMSNLTEPSPGNAASGVGSFASNMPYGSRLLQAAVSANCVGGKQWTNAARKVLLSTNNPLTGKTQVIQRSVEQLMRSPELPNINPYLMPNDAIACYDSTMSNWREVARAFSDIVHPFTFN